MSLSRLCLRIATVKALADKTFAEDRVRDSSIVNLESSIIDNPKTVILVYTDDTEFVPTGREVWGGTGTTNIVLIVAVAGAQKLQDGSVEFTFPPSDEATEISLDICERQIQAALMDPDSLWAQRWRGIVVNVSKWQSRRGASTKEGQRFAARQIVIECETNHDPIPGQPVQGEWATFLDVLENDDSVDISRLAAPLRVLMEKPTMADWKRSMSELGLDRQAAAGIGIAPFQFHAQPPAEQPATLTTIGVEDAFESTEISEGSP